MTDSGGLCRVRRGIRHPRDRKRSGVLAGAVAGLAVALGWPNTPIGFADLIKLANDPTGWAAKGHPEWGQFRLGKTNPHLSTSALNATIAQYYAATGKTSGLTVEDLNRPDVADFNRKVESAVVHYGDTTLTFLNNQYRADQRG